MDVTEVSAVTGPCGSHFIYVPRSGLSAVNASAAPWQMFLQRHEFGLVLYHAQAVPLQIVIADVTPALAGWRLLTRRAFLHSPSDRRGRWDLRDIHLA